jgi:hypothetical protein
MDFLMNPLANLINAPGVGVADVEGALMPHFSEVFIEERGEPFFTHHVRCIDRNGRTCLLVRFGWCEQAVGWMFEILPQRRQLPPAEAVGL